MPRTPSRGDKSLFCGILHSRTPSWGDGACSGAQAELQRALAALAFRAGTACAPYAALFEEGAWRACADAFCKDLYRLHAMPPLSQLVVHLQARDCGPNPA
jgi:hypothetical protein